MRGRPRGEGWPPAVLELGFRGLGARCASVRHGPGSPNGRAAGGEEGGGGGGEHWFAIGNAGGGEARRGGAARQRGWKQRRGLRGAEAAGRRGGSAEPAPRPGASEPGGWVGRAECGD